MADWTAIEAKYELPIPDAVRSLYAESDGERELVAGWRLQTLSEICDCGFEERYLARTEEGRYARRLGGLLPLATNDDSDLLVLHVGGLLDGRISYMSHKEPAFRLAFSDLATFFRHREEAAANRKGLGLERVVRYRADRAAAKDRDQRAARLLRAQLKIPDDVDLSFLAQIWEVFGGAVLRKAN